MIKSFQAVTVTTTEPRTCSGCSTTLTKGKRVLAGFERDGSRTQSVFVCDEFCLADYHYEQRQAEDSLDVFLDEITNVYCFQ